MGQTPTYDALPAARRLAIEQQLYIKLFGEPFTDRKIPDDPSDRQREYLISCIRDAILRENDGSVLAPQALDPARELTARQPPDAAPQLVEPKERTAQAQQFVARLRTSDRFPHDLGPEIERARAILTAGEVPADTYGKEKGVRRKPIVARHLKPLGYAAATGQNGPGYLAFEKRREDGVRLTVTFDFGSWRNTVLGILHYVHGNLRVPVGVPCDASVPEVPVLTAELLDKTMANAAFAIEEIERFLDS